MTDIQLACLKTFAGILKQFPLLQMDYDKLKSELLKIVPTATEIKFPYKDGIHFNLNGEQIKIS